MREAILDFLIPSERSMAHFRAPQSVVAALRGKARNLKQEVGGRSELCSGFFRRPLPTKGRFSAYGKKGKAAQWKKMVGDTGLEPVTSAV